MNGSIAIPFSELFIDTVNMHGINWAICYYVGNGMSESEFWFWIKATMNQLQIG